MRSLVYPETEQLAIEILGHGKVLSYHDICHVQKIVPVTEPVMQFSEDALRECAKTNSQGANWRLVYITLAAHFVKNARSWVGTRQSNLASIRTGPGGLGRHMLPGLARRSSRATGSWISPIGIT